MDAIKFTCAKCDYQFVGTADNRQCPSCHRHTVLSDCPTCTTPVKSIRSRHRVYCSYVCMAAGYRRIHDANCLQCGTLFRPKGNVYKGEYYVQKYCSKDCHSESLRLPPKPPINPLVALEIRAIRSIAASARQAAKRNARKVRTCVDCGIQERRLKNGWHTGWRCNVCSASRLNAYIADYKQTETAKASRRRAKARRRAIERGAHADSIDPIAVFERDKWRCHICGIKTKKALRGTYEPLAPELDHIITLAQGGAHTWGNVACSCRECNHTKSSRSMGQQGFDFAVVM